MTIEEYRIKVCRYCGTLTIRDTCAVCDSGDMIENTISRIFIDED